MFNVRCMNLEYLTLEECDEFIDELFGLDPDDSSKDLVVV